MQQISVCIPKNNYKPKRRPRNPRHRIYVRNDRLIQKEIFKAIARRDISVRISTVCRNINISPPTFYLHYSDCNEVLSRYEMAMLAEFTKIPSTVKERTTTFTLLLIFIYHHRQYFRASFRSRNFYVLAQMLQELKVALVRADISQQLYQSYAASLTAHIVWWGMEERFAKEAISKYAQMLARVRLTRI